MGRVAACSPASGCLSCYLLDIWRSESPPVHQRMALTSVFKIPLPWPCGIPAHMVRGPPSVPLLPGDPLPPAPVLPAFFQQLSLLISFIIHKALPEQGERVLFHRKGGDVAINAVTATCTFRIVFFSPPRLPCGSDCGIVSSLCYLWSNCAFGGFNQCCIYTENGSTEPHQLSLKKSPGGLALAKPFPA